MRISGLMMNYYFICKRKLWCLAKNINLEETNENVKMGKLIDESRYALETKQIMIEGTVNIDFIRNWKVVHEVKKSKAIEEAAIWQVKYYIYFLKKRKNWTARKERRRAFVSTASIRNSENISSLMRAERMESIPGERSLFARMLRGSGVGPGRG